MTIPRKLAFDMSSFIWHGYKAGKDKENGVDTEFNGKKVTINSALYGYENVMNMMTMVLRDMGFNPIDCLLVFEGKSTKFKRLAIDNTYKGGGEASHAPQEYVEFQKLRDMLAKTWRDVGATALIQDGAEGDDTLGWLSQEYPGELVVATYDNDLSVLNTEEGETNAYGGTTRVWIDGKVGLIKYGAFEYRRVRIYKTLCGDTSDKIPGAVGFGPSAFFKLVDICGWDGIDELEAMLEANDLGPLYKLAEETITSRKAVPDLTPLAKLCKTIINSEDSVLKAWRVTQIRPDWVNTTRQPLQIIYGKVVGRLETFDERLEPFYGSSWLIDADSYDDAMETLLLEGAKGPFMTFDIETSTPEESDEWLAAQGDIDGVDQIGSVLTGFSLTFGANMQYSIYVSIDHADTKNISMSQARKMLEAAWNLGLENVIHNTFFELSVLYMAEDEDGTLWRDHWAENGFHGFVPNALDTKLEASYVNENIKLGLKFRSLHHLDYEQTSYDATTLLTGIKGEMFKGGRLIREWNEDTDIEPPPRFVESADGTEFLIDNDTQRQITGDWVQDPAPFAVMQQRRYKMRELPATAVHDYGADDTICTAALHIGFQLVMHLEHTWDIYKETELDAAYLHAKSFTDGMVVSIEKSRELEKIDDATYNKAWGTVRNYLIEKGWNGTVPPVFNFDMTCKEIKHAYAIVFDKLPNSDPLAGVKLDGEDGEEDLSGHGDEPEADDVEEEIDDVILKHKGRTPAKFAVLLRHEGHEVFASMLERVLKGSADESRETALEKFTAYVHSHFRGDPQFKISSKQMCHLLYDVMGCPIRIRNKATDKMRQAGIYEGNPKADALAMAYALRDMKDQPEIVEVLNGLKLMQMVKTRRSLYYSKYPNFVHWKTGKVHGSHNQCATNTRRASESKPNKQQLPKHPKIEGEPARFREVVVPHKKNAVIVSLDFDSQELRIIADYSRDQNMVDCFVGDNKKSMHSLTGNSIINARKLRSWSYEEFEAILKDKEHPDNKLAKEYRPLGKKVNFTTEFGAMAPKLAATMLCSEEEAQIFIDAKEAMFPGVVTWKEGVVEGARNDGFVTTMEGARRHLRDALVDGDRWVQSKAERQAVNTKVQGSAAEMTKRAEGRMWKDNLALDFDCVYIGPIHDEVVWSVLIEDLPAFLPRVHKCMVAPYGNMFIPIESSISFGPSFGEQTEIGLVPSTEAVAAGVKEMREAAEKAKEKAHV